MKIKKVISVVLSVLMILLAVTPSALAAVTWSESDVVPAANIMSDGGFDNAALGSTALGNGMVVTTPVGGDTTHGNVVKADSTFLRASDSNGELTSLTNAGKKVKVEFDYCGDSTSKNIRCEMRGIKGSGELVYTNQMKEPYWTGTRNEKITSDWKHFSAVLDTAALMKYYGKTSASGVYIYISSYDGYNNTGALYIDNISIIGEDVVIPLQQPSYKYGSGWDVDADAEDNNGVKGNVYKKTITVKNIGQEDLVSEIKDYKFNEGTYRFSVWFKEDLHNKLKITRMIRPYVGSDTLKSSTGNWFYNKRVDELGKWENAVMDFTVNSSNADKFNKNGIVIKWQGLSGDTGYNAETNGEYTMYFANIELVKYPDAATETVLATKSDVISSIGSNIAVEAEGYIDVSSEAVLTIDGRNYTSAAEVTSTENKYVKANYSFGANMLPDGTYPAVLAAKDIWGRNKSVNINVSVKGPQSYKTELYPAKWSGNILNFTEPVAVAGDSSSNKAAHFTDDETDTKFTKKIKDLIAEGKTVFEFSFTAQGNGDFSSSSETYVQFRTVMATEFQIHIPKNDMKDGEKHKYTQVIDLSEVDKDKYDSSWRVTFRNNANAGTITYSDISLKYLEKDEAASDFIAAKVGISNNEESVCNFAGTLILAEYSGDEMTDIKFKNVNLTATGGIEKGETRYINLYAQNYDSSKKYKMFLWDSLTGLVPFTNSLEK